MNIGLVVAMPEEAQHIYSRLGDFVERREEHGFDVAVYARGDKNIYIIGSGIGEINATLATQYLITNYAIDCIINFGVVGSFNSAYGCLDTVVVGELVHYDFSLNTLDSLSYGKYPFQREKAEFSTDDKMLNLVREVEPNIPIVKIATGDKFVADERLRSWIIDLFHADICDMESMGIYYAVKRYNVPCLFIKTVSDNADSSANISFAEVIENGVDAYVGIVEKLLAKLDMAIL